MPPRTHHEAARAQLRSAGLRVTDARLAVLALLSAGRAPMRASDLRRELGPSRCDRVTVYRALDVLVEAGLVRRALCPDGASGYEAAEGAEEGYRVLCRRTGRTERVEPALAQELSKAIGSVESKLRERGFTEVAHRLEFSAVAPPAESPSAPKASGPA